MYNFSHLSLNWECVWLITKSWSAFLFPFSCNALMWHGTLVWLCMKYVILFFNYHTLLIVKKYFYSAFSTIRDFYFFPNRWPLSVQYGVVPPWPHPTDQGLMFRRPPSRQGLSSSLWPQPPPPSPGSAHRGQGPRRRLMELPAGAGVYMSACMCWCSTWARKREEMQEGLRV